MALAHPEHRGLAPVSRPQQAKAGPRDEGAVAALVLALAGYVAIPVIPSVMAIWIGIAARRRILAAPELRGRRMAEAAILLGVVELVLAVVLVIGLIWFPLLVPGG